MRAKQRGLKRIIAVFFFETTEKNQVPASRTIPETVLSTVRTLELLLGSKHPKAGRKYFSLAFSVPGEEQAKRNQMPLTEDLDDEIPGWDEERKIG